MTDAHWTNPTSTWGDFWRGLGRLAIAVVAGVVIVWLGGAGLWFPRAVARWRPGAWPFGHERGEVHLSGGRQARHPSPSDL